MYYFDGVQQSSTAKLAAFFQKFKKTVSAVRVNDIKVTSAGVFVDNLFALVSEK